MTWEKFGWTAVLTLAILVGNSSVLAAPVTPITLVAKTISLEDLKGAPAKLNFMLDRITGVDFEKRVKSIDSGNSRLFEVLIEDSRKRAFLKPQPQAGNFADLVVSFEDGEVLFLEANVAVRGVTIFYSSIQKGPLKAVDPVAEAAKPTALLAVAKTTADLPPATPSVVAPSTAYDSLEAKMLDTLKCQWHSAYASCVGKTAADQQAAIEAATNGLLYISESDRAWVYSLSTTYTSFADFEAANAGKTLETRKTLPQFFTLLSKFTGDPVGDALATRYKQLATVWNKNFSSVNRQVYWVKDPINPTEVHVFILGLNSFGMAILETSSIET